MRAADGLAFASRVSSELSQRNSAGSPYLGRSRTYLRITVVVVQTAVEYCCRTHPVSTTRTSFPAARGSADHRDYCTANLGVERAVQQLTTARTSDVFCCDTAVVLDVPHSSHELTFRWFFFGCSSTGGKIMPTGRTPPVPEIR